MTRIVAAALMLFISAMPAWAVLPEEVLADPALELRARALSKDLRCMVCQNQSIDDSDAALAKDLRIIVRERLVAGDTDGEVIDFVVARYGEFVLLRPRISASTIALWASPFVLLIGGVAFIVARQKRQTEEDAALTLDEEARIEALLREHKS
jgi:cytochrome c-type biogenesis protein CcmH